jgi:Cu-Zn family superoxide dismutase
LKKIAVVSAVALLLAGCAAMEAKAPAASARLEPTKGNTARGSVEFVQRGDKVGVRVDVAGLKPNAEHGFHIHEKGDCSSGDGMSTGGHFNPDGKPHAAPVTSERHVGDMPALKADAQGVARMSFDLDRMSVAPGPVNIVGKGLIIHRDPDDFKTQPTGNSGPRIACAVITSP